MSQGVRTTWIRPEFHRTVTASRSALGGVAGGSRHFPIAPCIFAGCDVRMADIFSPEKRSDVMSRVRGKGNKATELRLIAIFREEKITGWRRGVKQFGAPDFVFPKRKLAVFVDGCFWHGCPDHGTLPKTNAEFWEKKITRNRERDTEVNRELKKRGWKVLRLWEHELRTKQLPKTLRRVHRAIPAQEPVTVAPTTVTPSKRVK